MKVLLRNIFPIRKKRKKIKVKNFFNLLKNRKLRCEVCGKKVKDDEIAFDNLTFIEVCGSCLACTSEEVSKIYVLEERKNG